MNVQVSCVEHAYRECVSTMCSVMTANVVKQQADEV